MNSLGDTLKEVAAPSPTMLILGLDIALGTSGWALLGYESGSLVDCGLIVTQSSDELVERLSRIDEEILAILDTYSVGIDVAIEDGVSHHSGLTTRRLAMAWGVAALAAHRRCGVSPVEVNLRRVKFLATGKGNASKQEVTAAAVERWGVKTSQPDIADACWVAEALRQDLHEQFGGAA